jgi:hypothetical protein
MTRRELIAAAAALCVPVSVTATEPEEDLVEVEIIPVDEPEEQDCTEYTYMGYPVVFVDSL